MKTINVIKDEYIIDLHKQIQLLNDINELNNKIIQSKDDYIKQLENKIDEIKQLSNKAISIAKSSIINNLIK